jgi:hypothetical protein
MLQTIPCLLLICQASYIKLNKLNVFIVVTLTIMKQRNRDIVKVIGLIIIGLRNARNKADLCVVAPLS